MSNPTDSLSGLSALVCGGSDGIGRAVALAFARAGAGVAVLARRRARLEEVARELSAAGAAWSRVVVADLDDREGLVGAVDSLVADVGPLHILVNNAGGPKGGPLLSAAPEEFLTAISRHVVASHVLVQRLMPGMTEAGYGRIINVISTSVREPIPNLGVSNTTRGAMASWAKSLSRELPPGVTINNVLPGFTDTARLASLKEARAAREGTTPAAVHAAWLAQVPERRLARPEETAAAVAFLASPAAAYIRGVSLPVDGGRLRSI
jgi:3-oxoacyl-[acyl-carrier protein] reductase